MRQGAQSAHQEMVYTICSPPLVGKRTPTAMTRSWRQLGRVRGIFPRLDLKNFVARGGMGPVGSAFPVVTLYSQSLCKAQHGFYLHIYKVYARLNTASIFESCAGLLFLNVVHLGLAVNK